MYRQVTLVTALTLSGCAAEPVRSSSTSTGITTVNLTSVGASVSSSSGFASESAGSSGESTGVTTGVTTGVASQTTLDPFTSGGVPDFATTGEDLPVGCGGKIDFLFIISRDSTMADQISPLESSLPGFVATMQSAFEEFDVHIMTVAADGQFWGMKECEDQCEATNYATCAPIGPVDYPCGAYVQPALTKCDETRSAGVTFPAAWGASNKRCQLAGGNRYIIDSEPDLLGAFECIATMGLTNNNGGVAAYAMLKALSEENLEPGGCNDGFLREDALLVVTLITDMSDNLSPLEPEDWALSLREIKGFDDDAIVILGLIPDGGELNNVCEGPGNGQYLPPLNKLLTLFPHTVLGSCCADNYVPFFEEAADMVLEVCEQYLPQ